MKSLKINIIKALRENGIDAAEVFDEKTLETMRAYDALDWDTTQKVCELLGCEIEDVTDWIKMNPPKK